VPMLVGSGAKSAALEVAVRGGACDAERAVGNADDAGTAERRRSAA
jgi:hypothetical protein